MSEYGLWNQTGQVITGTAFSLTGTAVDLSADGNVLAVAAPLHSEGVYTFEGLVSVHRLESGSWVRLAGITGRNSETLGDSVALSATGHRIAVGSLNYQNNTGRVLVYHTDDFATWRLLGNEVVDLEVGDEAGTSVSLNSDGTILVIGAPKYGSDNKGRVIIYSFSGSTGSTGTWGAQGYIVGETGDGAGVSVSLSADGSRVAFGSPSYSGNSGRVDVYNIDGSSSSEWRLVGGITGDAGDNVGWSVSLSDDGTRIAVGAPFHASSSGKASVYYLNPNEEWMLLGDGIVGSTGDLLGRTVSLNSKGNVLAFGSSAYDADGIQSSNHGRADIYYLEEGAATWRKLMQGVVGETGDSMGYSVALNAAGDRVAIGAINSKANGSVVGSVRVYTGALPKHDSVSKNLSRNTPLTPPNWNFWVTVLLAVIGFFIVINVVI